MKIFVFGNGNISFADYLKLYTEPIRKIGFGPDIHFILCDFRRVDTFTMEFLKDKTSNVDLYHIGEMPRYLPDEFKTKAGEWNLVGGFQSDKARDLAAIENCTHNLAFDFNSDEARKSGTQRNIEKCLGTEKIRL